jgi:hypothetical protein
MDQDKLMNVIQARQAGKTLRLRKVFEATNRYLAECRRWLEASGLKSEIEGFVPGGLEKPDDRWVRRSPGDVLWVDRSRPGWDGPTFEPKMYYSSVTLPLKVDSDYINDVLGTFSGFTQREQPEPKTSGTAAPVSSVPSDVSSYWHGMSPFASLSISRSSYPWTYKFINDEPAKPPEFPTEHLDGYITAWREWLLVPGRGLRSQSYQDIWEPGVEIHSECKEVGEDMAGLANGHPRPEADCTCGIYALKKYTGPDPVYKWEDEGVIYGRVALWGKIIECEDGYRAECAYPLDLYVPRDLQTPENLELLRQYKVPIYFLKMVEEKIYSPLEDGYVEHRPSDEDRDREATDGSRPAED